MDRWDEVEGLFEEALGLAPGARAALLNAVAARDPALHAELASLLEANDAAPEFFDGLSSALGAAASWGLDTASPDPGAPRQVGPYAVEREIGRGGMSVVYLAHRADGQFEQAVALKVIRRGGDRQASVHRFLAERQILASLSHPAVARLYDGGVLADGRPYFVMEYVDGQPIDRYCDAHRLSLDARLRLFLAVLEAVQYAHQNLVVHRDLKPSNILVTERGHVKLLDFGIAKLLEDEPEHALTETGGRWMTPEYAAPEQIRGERVTTATDVYQLGVMLYRLLTGHRPYRLATRSTYEVERAVIEIEPTRPSTVVGKVEEIQRGGATHRITPESVSQNRSTDEPALRRTLAGDLDAIVMMALRKEAEARYPSVEAFAEDVRRYLARRPVEARRGSVAYRVRKFVRRHRWGVGAAVLFVVLLLGYAATLRLQALEITRERDRARLEAAKAAQVTEFLVDLFETSDPNQAQGNAVTARELLDRGATRVEGELAGQPAVQAEALAVIGQIYGRLGLFDEAAGLLTKALALRQGAAVPPLDLAESHYHLADVLDRRGDYEAAEAQLHQALALAGGLQEGRALRAGSLRLLAALRMKQDDFAAADSLYHAALALQREVLGAEHDEVAATLSDLARLRHGAGDLAAADSLFGQALALRRRLGPDHLEHAAMLADLAHLREDQDRFDEAETLYQQALALYRRLVGNEHPEVAATLNDLGLLYRDVGDLKAAERLLREALALKQRLLGDEHPSLATAYFNLGAVLHDEGDLEAAEAFYRLTLAIDRAVYKADHSEIANDLTKLAAVLADQGRLGEAEDLLGQALAIRRAALPAGLTGMSTTLLELGRLRLRQGRAAEAETFLREALDIRRNALADDHWRVAEVGALLGRALLVQRRYAEAAPLVRASAEAYTAHFGPTHRRTQPLLADLAALDDARE